MYKIGEFARLGRVSARMLRNYDALGLLRPAYVEPSTGYRLYTADQLARLSRLVALKDLGFSLDQIGAMLDPDLPAGRLQELLRRREAEVERLLRDEQRRLAQIRARLSRIEREGRAPAYEVVVRPIAPQPVAAARAILPDDSAVAALLDDVERHVGRQQARADHPPTVVYHGCEGRAMRVEVAVPLKGRLRGAGRVCSDELPGAALAACLLHTDGDATLGAAYGALRAWVADSGYQIAGPMREVYLRYAAPPPSAVPLNFVVTSPEAAITELQIPIALA